MALTNDRNVVRVQTNPYREEGAPIVHVEWNDEHLEIVRVEWLNGLTAVQIGKKIGRTKNSVLSKVRKLKLPSRGSPIQERIPDHLASRRVLYERARQQRKRLLGKLGSPLEAMVDVVATAAHDQRMSRPTVTPKPPRPAPAPKPIIAPPTPVYGRVVECSWPLGEPRTASFRYCDEPSKPGKSFCREHHAIAYSSGPMQECTIDRLSRV